ncbi:MAG: class II aldolase/adducin family protein [Clostridia bacterium]|nr:class II aldolase/adducin family protein [Clostridia bacterium]
MGLEIIAEISHKYGADSRYVLAGGGNTSYKNDEHLYIKGSGHALATITNDGFVKMSREKLAQIWTKVYSQSKDEREAQVLSDMMASRCEGEESKRPSVETLLHNLFKQTYVLHVHPTMVNGLTCAINGKKIVSELFENAIWVEETEPGYVLASKCREMINDYELKTGKTADLLFLQNHGIFFAGNSKEEIDALVSTVMTKIEEISKIIPDMTEIECAPELSTAFEMAVKEAYPVKEISTKFTLNKEVKRLCSSYEEFSVLMQPMSPDHIVYCKAIPLFIDTLDSQKIKQELDEFEKKHGYLPKIIFAKDIGMLAIGNSEKDACTVTEVWLDAVKISVYAQSFGGVRHMAPDMVDFIVNWEVESYRSKVALNTAK